MAGGGSRKLAAILQPGSEVEASFVQKSPEDLGRVRVEPIGPGISCLLDDPLALSALSSAAVITTCVLPERSPMVGVYFAFKALLTALELPDIWPAIYVRYELGLLDAVGFGLDLQKCAATGSFDDLIYVSPKSGRAVSATAGAPYQDRLLALPGFLLSSQHGIGPGDIAKGLALTGFFLERHVFHPLDRPLPPPRVWLLDRLRAKGWL